MLDRFQLPLPLPPSSSPFWRQKLARRSPRVPGILAALGEHGQLTSWVCGWLLALACVVELQSHRMR